MTDGYTSPGGTQINLEALMMVAYAQNQQDGSGQVNLLAQSRTQINLLTYKNQKELKVQGATIKESTARVIAAQEQLIQEAYKAKKGKERLARK